MNCAKNPWSMWFWRGWTTNRAQNERSDNWVLMNCASLSGALNIGALAIKLPNSVLTKRFINLPLFSFLFPFSTTLWPNCIYASPGLRYAANDKPQDMMILYRPDGKIAIVLISTPLRQKVFRISGKEWCPFSLATVEKLIFEAIWNNFRNLRFSASFFPLANPRLLVRYYCSNVRDACNQPRISVYRRTYLYQLTKYEALAPGCVSQYGMVYNEDRLSYPDI